MEGKKNGMEADQGKAREGETKEGRKEMGMESNARDESGEWKPVGSGKDDR